jgi:hypothetical protein
MIPVPLRNIVLLSPETPEQARSRLSFLHVFDSADAVRTGYPEAALRAEVLACGPEVREVKPGDVVLLLAYKNLEDTTFVLHGQKVIFLEEGKILGVVES